MKTIKLSKSELLSKLHENLQIHNKEFEELYAAYLNKAEKALKDRLKKVKKGESFDLVFRLSEPHSYEEEYLTAIEMVEMSVGEEIDIEAEDFKCWVQNKWGWSNSFEVTKSFYLNQ